MTRWSLAKPLLGGLLSLLLTILGGVGILLFVVLGVCYQSGDPQFAHGLTPDQLAQATSSCFTSAIVYLVVFLFGAFQFYLNKRQTPSGHAMDLNTTSDGKVAL